MPTTFAEEVMGDHPVVRLPHDREVGTPSGGETLANTVARPTDEHVVVFRFQYTVHEVGLYFGAIERREKQRGYAIRQSLHANFERRPTALWIVNEGHDGITIVCQICDVRQIRIREKVIKGRNVNIF